MRKIRISFFLLAFLFISLFVFSSQALTEVDTLRVEATNQEIETIATDENYIYATITVWQNSVRLYRIDIDTFTKDASYIDFNDVTAYTPYSGYSIVIGNYLYVSCYNFTATWLGLAKIDLTLWNINDTLNSGEFYYDLDYDGSQYLYAVFKDGIDKIDLTSFTVADTLSGAPPYWDAAELQGDFLYVMESTNPVPVTKVALSTFTIVENYTLPTGYDNLGQGWANGWSVGSDENYLYMIHEIQPPLLSRTDIPALSSTDNITFTTGTSGMSMAVYPDLDGYEPSDRIYVGDYDIPVYINDAVRSGFIENDVVEGSAELGVAYCMTVGTDGYLYVGFQINGWIGKFDPEYSPTRIITAQQNINANLELAAMILVSFWAIIFVTHLIYTLDSGNSEYFFHLLLSYTVAIIVILALASIVLTI